MKSEFWRQDKNGWERQGCATILTFHMWHCFLPIGTSFGVFQIGTDLGFAELGQVLDLALFPSFGLAKSEISRRTKFWALPRRKFQTGTRFGFCGKWAKFMRMARQWRQPPFVLHHPNIITGVNILAESSLLLPSQLRDLVDFFLHSSSIKLTEKFGYNELSAKYFELSSVFQEQNSTSVSKFQFQTLMALRIHAGHGWEGGVDAEKTFCFWKSVRIKCIVLPVRIHLKTFMGRQWLYLERLSALRYSWEEQGVNIAPETLSISKLF